MAPSRRARHPSSATPVVAVSAGLLAAILVVAAAALTPLKATGSSVGVPIAAPAPGVGR